MTDDRTPHNDDTLQPGYLESLPRYLELWQIWWPIVFGSVGVVILLLIYCLAGREFLGG